MKTFIIKSVSVGSLILAGSIAFSGCTSVSTTTSTSPSPTYTTAHPEVTGPDVLVPIGFALEKVIGADLQATSSNIRTYLITNPGATTIPDEQIVNSNPNLEVIKVTKQPDGSFLVTGKTSSGQYPQQVPVSGF
jgi:hypothetical protein